MIFCLGEGRYEKQGIGYQNSYMIFNQKVDKEEWSEIRNSLPTINLQITKWIDKSDMTKEEKENNSVWKEIGGYLKRYTYEEAWKNWIDNAKQDEIEAIFNCKYYDEEIFKSITGCELKREVQEVTMKEVCEKFGREVKIKK